jgi:hypothetical protein
MVGHSYFIFSLLPVFGSVHTLYALAELAPSLTAGCQFVTNFELCHFFYDGWMNLQTRNDNVIRAIVIRTSTPTKQHFVQASEVKGQRSKDHLEIQLFMSPFFYR